MSGVGAVVKVGFQWPKLQMGDTYIRTEKEIENNAWAQTCQIESCFSFPSESSRSRGRCGFGWFIISSKLSTIFSVRACEPSIRACELFNSATSARSAATTPALASRVVASNSRSWLLFTAPPLTKLSALPSSTAGRASRLTSSTTSVESTLSSGPYGDEWGGFVFTPLPSPPFPPPHLSSSTSSAASSPPLLSTKCIKGAFFRRIIFTPDTTKSFATSYISWRRR